jgi:hypothetical protein
VIRTLSTALLLICAAGTAAFAQSTIAQFWGSTPNQQVGSSVAEIGDINNDGYVDMLVGSPAPGAQGSVYFVSGYYLRTGNGFATLGATFASSSGGLFGNSVLGLGDVTGDGVEDVMVGEPGVGKVHIVSGSSKAVVKTYVRANSTLGVSLAHAGDVDGDGYMDVVIGCSSAPATGAGFTVLSPRKLYLGTSSILKNVNGFTTGCGYAVSAGDIDNDGVNEYVIGDPNTDSIYVFEQGGNTPSKTVVWSPNSAFGVSIDARRDINGDGSDDILVGAYASETVFLLSGALVAAGSGVQNASAVDLANWTNGIDGSGYGFTVMATPDMNADNVPDIVIGAPLLDTLVPFGADRGAVYFISGNTKMQMGYAQGASDEQLGAALSSAADYNGDGYQDIAAGGPLSNVGANDAGLMRIFSLFPAGPKTYCVAKLNSLACTPVIGFNGGSASLSAATPFNVTVTNMINNKPGMLLYGYFPDNAVFQGGVLCVKSPIKRVGVQNTQGNPPPNDCSGHLTYDFNARIQSGLDPALTVQGHEVFCQYWSRDPADPNGSSLSNGLGFVINP